MPCKILEVVVSKDSEVKKGDLLCVTESMKMEMKVYAQGPGL